MCLPQPCPPKGGPPEGEAPLFVCIGVLFSCFGRKIGGPGLPGGLIIYQGHLVPLKGHLCLLVCVCVCLFGVASDVNLYETEGEPCLGLLREDLRRRGPKPETVGRRPSFFGNHSKGTFPILSRHPSF